jgi:dephospho-CoA kinase
MSLIYVTGVSGTGKSSVRKELQQRGYEAHDTDENGFRGWYDLETKQWVDSDLGYNDASREWLRRHHLRIKRAPVEAIVPPDPDKVVFLCGTVPNETDVWDLFDKAIYLIISEKVLRERIASRTNNKFGKHPEELEGILSWHRDSPEAAKRVGAIIIDAEQPLENVVDEVIKAAND